MLTKPPKTGVDLEQGQGSSWLEHSEDFHRCETHPGALKSALITPGINYINFSDTSGWEAVVALRTTADFWGHFLIWTNPLRSLSFLLAR